MQSTFRSRVFYSSCRAKWSANVPLVAVGALYFCAAWTDQVFLCPSQAPGPDLAHSNGQLDWIGEASRIESFRRADQARETRRRWARRPYAARRMITCVSP